MDTGPAPLVSIGIPAYNATSFLEATVRSACAQDYPHVRLIVSVDQSTDGTVDLARRLAAEHGFELIVQPRRLGWIGNSNAVLRRMTSEFGMILPHDDLLSPSYVSRCMAALLANEASVVACSDLECVPAGTIVPQLELRGDRELRVAKCVKDGFLAVSYRGVLRFNRFRRREVPNAIGGFAADALWMVRMAIAGEIVRVPEVLYRKTFHATSAHRAWTQMTDRQDEREMARPYRGDYAAVDARRSAAALQKSDPEGAAQARTAARPSAVASPPWADRRLGGPVSHDRVMGRVSASPHLADRSVVSAQPRTPPLCLTRQGTDIVVMETRDAIEEVAAGLRR